jgi:hypothetical protein
MRIEKSNKLGRFLKTTLMVIGAGALAVYFSDEKNRIRSQKKASELGNYLLGKVKEEKDYISNKSKDLMNKTKDAGKDINKTLSEYGNNIVKN